MSIDSIYYKEAKRIIDLLKSDFLLDSGTLCLKLDKTKNYKSPNHIFPDLGDFLPFFLYFGEKDFIKKQIEILKQNLKNGLLVSEFPTLKIKGLAKSYEYSDFLLGLLDNYLYFKNEESKKLLIDHVDRSIEIFNFNGKIKSFYEPTWKMGFPIVDSRDGMMIEVFVDLYKIFNNKKYLDVSFNIFKELTSSSFYKKHNIFPTFSSRGLWQKLFSLNKTSKFNQGKLGKCNTNTLFALLSLWQETKNENVFEVLLKTTKTIQQKAVINGGVVVIYLPNEKDKMKVCLTPSFAMLDFLCDFYYNYQDDELLIFAENIAKYWLDRQTEKGLFPLYDNSATTFFDSETDMTVALYKLNEITEKEKYKIAADKCLTGILKYHGQYNYVNGIDLVSGEVTDHDQKSKFLSLFLKLLILKINLDEGKKIYQNEELFNLLKDR